VADRKKTSAGTTPDNGMATIVLDRAAALVLFEFLARTIDEEDGEPLKAALADPAELSVLWSVLTELEEVLTEPFDDDYRALLAEARAKVAAKFGGR
jgi:hypothetical protein